MKPISFMSFACVGAWIRLAVMLCCVNLTTMAARSTAVLGPAAFARTLAESIDLAGTYLTQNCLDDGRFVYRRHLTNDRAYGAKYNVLRHAGAIYALAAYYEHTQNGDAKAAMLRAGENLLTKILGPVPGRQGMRAAWTRPTELGHKLPSGPVQAKLGGAGLALVALIALRGNVPGAVPLDELREIGEFVLFMQKADGSFYSKYYVPDGPSDAWVSLYYPGEAMLGLTMLYEEDPNEKWLRSAALGMANLARTRADQQTVPADHWALLATEVLLRHYDELKTPPVPVADILRHARQICRIMLSDQLLNPEDPLTYGAFAADGRTCPSAIRLEGLLAAWRFLPAEDVQLKEDIANAAEAGVGFLMRTQATKGALAGAIPRAACSKPATRANHAFNRRVGEVRIDYVQHALSALLAYDTLRRQRGSARPPTDSARPVQPAAAPDEARPTP